MADSTVNPEGGVATPGTELSNGFATAEVDLMAQAFASIPLRAKEAREKPQTRLKPGDVIQGVVAYVDRDTVLVDVGMKSEGMIRRNELSRDQNQPIEEIVKVGDRIDVFVMETESGDGNLILSKKRADFEKAWDRVREARDSGATIHAIVTERVKGGLTVDVGIRGFVPASHVGHGQVKTNLDKYVGQSIPLKVIEVDKDAKKVVLSNRQAEDEERESKRSETLSALHVDQACKGVVRRLTDYGAFIDLGGIDGLLHISEMSWTRITHPKDVLHEGQEVEVVVLKMDPDQGRISLSMRHIQPDPWSTIAQRYAIGDVLTGQLTRIVQFGAFVLVDNEVEGIIPQSELGSRKGQKTPFPVPGDIVQVKVIDLKPEERKMTLSLRQVKQDEEERVERSEIDQFQEKVVEREADRFTIGDALKARDDET